MVVMHEIAADIKLSHKMKDLTVDKEVTFVEALNEKYVDQDEIDNQFTVPKDKSISTEIMFVGFGKVASVQRQLRRLASIDLSGRNIHSAGELSSVTGSLDRVVVINLAENHLTWNELIKILSCLPNLREIIISTNDLQTIDDIKFPESTFKRLTSLVMGRVDLSWQSTVDILSKIWTSIEQIDLWNNQLSESKITMTDKDCKFVEHITSLVMSQNKFLDLNWLPNMGCMPNLRDLDLSRCQIKSVCIDQALVEHLKSLETLNISYNIIEDWQSMSNLNQLPRLTSLICNDNPFFLTEKLARLLTVAQIANIKTLNREVITNTFRRDSEITYIRKVFPEYKAFKDGSNSDFRRSYPRYEELIELYGLPEDLITKQTSDDKYIIVELCYKDMKVVKKLPCDMRVSNLQMLCKRLFKIRPSNSIEIVCCADDTSGESLSYPLDKDGQTLHFFSVKSNNRLIIK